MATATLTRGDGYWVQTQTLYTTKGQSNPDWTWYIGHWAPGNSKEAEYAAGYVEYMVPAIGDRLLSRTLSIQFKFYGYLGSCEAYAVLSTKNPNNSIADFRFGPTGGVISNVVKVKSQSSSLNETTLHFTLSDSVDISGKTIYLYLYRPNEGYDAYGPQSAIVTYSMSDGSLTYEDPYSLTMTPDAGSIIEVNRTASGTGKTGNLKSGSYLYYGDKLKITFSPKSNYKILTSIVNGKSFTSGNTIDVNGDVKISATSQPLASAVGATNADIESRTSISIMPYSSGYTHTLNYNFGSLSGTIVNKTNLTSYSWIVPSAFYSQIPNNVSGTCTIICETYDGEELVGTSSCAITVRASYDKCAPVVEGSVIDTNTKTVALTNRPTILIKYLSHVLCTISASAKNGATIVSMEINGTPVRSEMPTRVYSSTDISKFIFVAVDSRGYTSTYTVTPTIVPYVKLTLNPILSRQSMTSNSAILSFNGNFYNGSFGAAHNTLRLKYRYKLSSDNVYGEWISIDSSNYIVNSGSYYSNGSIVLKDNDGGESGFDYKKSYDFQIVSTDGTSDIDLCTVTTTDVLKRGEPVFDWGENDFNFNVDVRMFGTSLLDIFYPIGSVFTSINDTLPQALSVGDMTWETIQTSIDGTYSWKRVS